jgi:hypothetical protein
MADRARNIIPQAAQKLRTRLILGSGPISTDGWPAFLRHSPRKRLQNFLTRCANLDVPLDLVGLVPVQLFRQQEDELLARRALAHPWSSSDCGSKPPRGDCSEEGDNLTTILETSF